MLAIGVPVAKRRHVIATDASPWDTRRDLDGRTGQGFKAHGRSFAATFLASSWFDSARHFCANSAENDARPPCENRIRWTQLLVVECARGVPVFVWPNACGPTERNEAQPTYVAAVGRVRVFGRNMRARCAHLCRLGLCPDRVGSETQPTSVAAAGRVRPWRRGWVATDWPRPGCGSLRPGRTSR